jgi:2'-5' RNA ligase
VALALPAAVKDELGRAIDSLEQHVAGARWVPKENLHLTLAFLGRVDDGRVGEISSAIAGAVQGHVDFNVRIGELGAFPSAKRARVLWAGLDDPTRGIAGLAESVGEALEPLGFPREKRAFAAHVTLARMKSPRSVDLNAMLEPISFPVERISLFESRLGRPNAVYSELTTFPFRRGS